MISIRKIHDSEILAFAKVHLECWKETYSGIYDAEVFEVREQKQMVRVQHIKEQMMKIDSYFYYALFDDFSVVGILIFSILDGKGLIDAIYVKQNYQKKGYGKKMLHLVEQTFYSHDIQEYFVYVLKMLKANEFFIHCGGKYFKNEFVSVHGKDYIECVYQFKVGSNYE
ncbi:MAG: GNAT family N-acetyltransferase [Bacilli bacterium]|nr:GNAT family N-acetyltransferase [Bacilli bacterium]